MDRFHKAGCVSKTPQPQHSQKSPLDRLLDQVSYARPSPQQRKLEATQKAREKTQRYLASKELNPDVRKALSEFPLESTRCNDFAEAALSGARPKTASFKSRFQQSEELNKLLEAETRESRTSDIRAAQRDFVKRFAYEMEDPLERMNSGIADSEDKRKRSRLNSNSKTRRPKTEFDAFKADQILSENISRCPFCIDSELCQSIRRQLFISNSKLVYLASMTKRDIIVPFHSSLCPLEHVPNSVMLEDDVLDHIRNYKKSLRNFFSAMQTEDCMEACGYTKGPYKPVFVEWHIPRKSQDQWEQISTKDLGRGAHASIDVLILNEDDYEQAKMIVAQEFGAVGGDVNRVNKSYRKQMPAPKRGPKDLIAKSNVPYIFFDFGMSQSFIHTLEDNSLVGNLREKVDRKYLRDLMISFYPESVRDGVSGLDWETYLKRYRSAFQDFDWTTEKE